MHNSWDFLYVIYGNGGGMIKENVTQNAEVLFKNDKFFL